MARLIQLENSLMTYLLSSAEKNSIKGKGMGNMNRMDGKNCPPPVEEGKLEYKSKHNQ